MGLLVKPGPICVCAIYDDDIVMLMLLMITAIYPHTWSGPEVLRVDKGIFFYKYLIDK